MPWPVYLAFKQLFPAGRRFSFFTIVSVCGVMLGVMILLIVQSVMNGFQEEIREKIIDTSGHIRVESAHHMSNYEEVLELLRAYPEVVGAAPYAWGFVMVQHGRSPAFPLMRGIDVLRDREVIPYEDFIVIGDIDDLDDDSVFLSSGLARAIGAGMGSLVEVYSPLMLERLKQDEILLPRELEVVGIIESGWGQIDESTMVGTMRLMQDLYGMEDSVHGISVRLRDGVDADAMASTFNRDLPRPLFAMSWLDFNRDFLFILRLEKNVLFFLLLFIVLVAAFAIASSLLITVVRKTREIGLLGALGARPMHVAMSFCFQGFFIGVTGMLAGVGAAVVVLHFRNDIIYQFARLTQSEEALVRFYQFADIPMRYSIQDFIVIIFASVVASTLAGLLPAWRAARLKPTEAFRHE